MRSWAKLSGLYKNLIQRRKTCSYYALELLSF